MDDSKLLSRLPSPRSLSLLFQQYNKYEGYDDNASYLNTVSIQPKIVITHRIYCKWMSKQLFIVALRYCHSYIPGEYQLLTTDYDFLDKKILDDKLSSAELGHFFKQVLRGLFTTKILKDNYSQCSTANNYTGYKDNLRTLNSQAARDACVEPYLQYVRAIYNFSATEDWQVYERFFRGDKIKALSYLYKIPQEMELAVGGALDIYYQSIFGNVFKIFIGNFFSNLRCADPNF